MGADATQPGPARSSQPWNFKVSLSPAPTQPQRCYLTWPGSSSPCTPSGPMSPPRPVTLAEAHPLYQVLTTPARDQGSRPPPSLLAETLGKDLRAPEPSWPPTPGSLPSHVAPAHRYVVRCVSHGGNKRLKRAMVLSAFASLRSDPVSRAYYQRKRDQGKRHNQAVLALAHRRILTLHAMIRNGALYDPQPATKLPAAA